MNSAKETYHVGDGGITQSGLVGHGEQDLQPGSDAVSRRWSLEGRIGEQGTGRTLLFTSV